MAIPAREKQAGFGQKNTLFIKIPQQRMSGVVIFAAQLDHGISPLAEIQPSGHLQRQLQQVEDFKREESRLLPENMDYHAIAGLRLEAREKLDAVRPMSVGQAGRISGVSPSDIAVLLIWLEQNT